MSSPLREPGWSGWLEPDLSAAGLGMLTVVRLFLFLTSAAAVVYFEVFLFSVVARRLRGSATGENKRL